MQITISTPNQWGFFNVTIASFGEIKGCKYKTGEKDGKAYAFVALPQHKITGKDGADKWVGDLFLERPVLDKIAAAYKAQAAAPAVGEEDIPF